MNIKSTTEEFIRKSNITHNNKYDYSVTEYFHSAHKLNINCTIHGVFSQRAKDHLEGRGCPKCGRITQASNKRIGVINFVKKATKVHGNLYDYSKVEYVTHYSPVIIVCKEHGEFKQQPLVHLRGHGCKKCSKKLSIGYSRSEWIKYCSNKTDVNPQVYIIRLFNKNENFIKIGITTTSIQKRISGNIPYSYEVIKSIYGSPDFVFDLEHKLHKKFLKYKYLPKKSFSGETECFTLSILTNQIFNQFSSFT